jgi:hypothetical protein
MYYGNSSAAAVSSGDSTFIFFDDFETVLLREMIVLNLPPVVLSFHPLFSTGLEAFSYLINLMGVIWVLMLLFSPDSR